MSAYTFVCPACYTPDDCEFHKNIRVKGIAPCICCGAMTSQVDCDLKPYAGSQQGEKTTCMPAVMVQAANQSAASFAAMGQTLALITEFDQFEKHLAGLCRQLEQHLRAAGRIPVDGEVSLGLKAEVLEVHQGVDGAVAERIRLGATYALTVRSGIGTSTRELTRPELLRLAIQPAAPPQVHNQGAADAR